MNQAVGRTDQSSRPLWGIGLLVFCTFLFATVDSIGKLLVERYPAGEILFFRYGFFVLVMVIWIRPARVWDSLRSVRQPWLQVARGSCSALDQVLFVTGLQFLALADSHVLVTSAPLVVTVLSVWILKERVGVRRWGAVLIGFSGVLFVLQPGGDLFRPAALFPLSVVFLFAFYQILTRVVNRTDAARATMLYTGLTGFVFYSLLAPFGWVTPQGSDWLLLLVLGIIALLSHGLLITAIRWAPVSVLQPYFYLTLVWAILLGWVFFDHLPSGASLLGAGVIVACGLYALYRERKTLEEAAS